MVVLMSIEPTESECAAVEVIPREARCPHCAGFGWRILSAYSYRWRRIEQHTRETCDVCCGTGRRDREEAA